VSGDGQAVALMPRRSTGYCVIRVEAEQRGLLIVLLLNPDGGQVATERTRKVHDLEEAVGIVREFLGGFVTNGTKQSE
jgi:hypothetical protein